MSKKQIIDFIAAKNLYSTQVADALGKRGALPGFEFRGRDPRIVTGLTATFVSPAATNYDLHAYIPSLSGGEVLFVDSFACSPRAILGDLVCDYLFKTKKIRALVVKGGIRDADSIYAKNYAVWSTFVNPVGVVNQPVPHQSVQPEKSIVGGVMVCDKTGVVHIPEVDCNEIFIEKLAFIATQEQIWDYCINTLQWTAYETICEKKYLESINQDAFLAQQVGTLVGLTV